MLSIIAGLLLLGSVQFHSPIADSIVLAGNLGEPRPNHFHGGVDIKTGGVEGKHIYAIGDGFVSRVTMGLYGFGNAVYVTHPEGYTSIYCHLRSFAPTVKNALQRWRYRHESNTVDVNFEPTDCPVSQGQLIAISGNTGHSMAPHLHLEIHETKTWAMLDPLDFIGHLLHDGQPPLAHGFMACPQAGKGLFNGGRGKQTFGFSSHHLDRNFTAWGKVGFAIWANDYMEAAYNSYGIRETILTVNGRIVFRSNVDYVPVWSNLMVNSWGDYEHWLRSRVWYMKSFREPGNTLALIQTDENDGIVDFNEEKVYYLEYTLRDALGNESKYSFEVEGVKADIASSPKQPIEAMKWDIINTWTVPGVQLVVPQGCLVGTFVPSAHIRQGSYSALCSFTPTPFQLFNNGELSLYVHRKVTHPSKLYIVEHYGSDQYMGGVYKNGWVSGRIRRLDASYEVAYDDAPPSIRAVSLGESIVISVSDDESGLQGYTATLDGRFIAFEPKDKSHIVTCRLSESPIRKTGKSHRLRFSASDNCGNARTLEANVIY